MDAILDELETIAQRCEQVAKSFDKEPLAGIIQRLTEAVEDVGRSWSLSWLDYHSTVYLTDFKPAMDGEVFDPVWGIRAQSTRGDWTRTTFEDVLAEIQRRSELADLKPIEQAAKTAQEAFHENRSELMPMLDALNSNDHDTSLQAEKTKLSNLKANSSIEELLRSVTPRQLPTGSRDELVKIGGIWAPHHIRFRCWLLSQASFGTQLKELAGIARHIKRYLEIKYQMTGKSKAEEKATISHGRPDTSQQPNESFQDRPKEGDEFNQLATAGMTTKDQFEAVMDEGDIISIPTWRQVVQEIIDGKRDRHLHEKKLGVREFVEFFSAPPNHAHRTVETYPEPDAIRVMVIVSEATEGPHGQWFFRWKAAVPYQEVDAEPTSDEEMFFILDAVRRFSEGTECLIPALPVSKVTGLSLQLVEDSFELLAGDGYVLHDHDSGGHAAELKAKGRQFLREYARRRMTTKDAGTTSPVRIILILAANPKGTDLERFYEEVKNIDQGLERARKRDQFMLVPELAVTYDDLRRALLDNEPEIVHLSGHGSRIDGLAFENEAGQPHLIPGDSLARLFELCVAHVKCVVMNASYSEAQADAIAQHIDYVVGVKKAIGDKAAIKFAVGFYDAIGAGRDVEKAFRFGCSAIDLKGIAEYLTPLLKKKSLPSPHSAIRSSTSQAQPSTAASSGAQPSADPPQVEELGKAIPESTGGENSPPTSVTPPTDAAPTKPAAPISVFYSYSHKDEKLREKLEEHLSLLKRQGIIAGWHDRRIGAGEEWKGAIDKNLEEAQVILLLVSSSFLASNYCWDVETKRAIDRHDRGEAKVIPIILRPVDWHGAPFGKLQALPREGKPVVEWRPTDSGFKNVAEGIRRIVEAMTANPR